jgi:hypothetical protein
MVLDILLFKAFGEVRDSFNGARVRFLKKAPTFNLNVKAREGIIHAEKV